MKFNYLGYDVLVCESTRFSVGGTDEEPKFSVDGGGAVIHLAACSLGQSYGLSAQEAIDGIRNLIQKKLAGVS